ncbi:hypothetical protein AGLY_018240 [Aphis glycines]|uniref:CCHC-type domain-containing protein n=1 Tax=Aphis glycines TaxID=307491 RepID=A0A6G0SSJ3_APHGL|nr:hypothetical protein AGLY_018240 [Aphis glycines]
MIAAIKLTGKAYNVTRYKEINAWDDLKQIILDALESPYGVANLQIELNIIKIKPNDRRKNIISDDDVTRKYWRTGSGVSYINGLTGEIKFEVKAKNPTTLEHAMQIALMADKNIRTYNEVQDIFKNNEPPNRPFNKNFSYNETQNMFRNSDQYNNRPYNQSFNHERYNNPPSYNRYNNINNTNNGNTNGNQNTRNNNLIVKRCFTCNREVHFASQCRANVRPLNRYNQTHDGLGFITYVNETCSYCNKRGHMADVCFKKQRDEQEPQNIWGYDLNKIQYDREFDYNQGSEVLANAYLYWFVLEHSKWYASGINGLRPLLSSIKSDNSVNFQ